MKYTTAEEIDRTKNKVRQERTQRLTKDRKHPHGRNDLAATDGLKVIRKTHNGAPTTWHDDEIDEVIDLRRVRNLKDVTRGYNDGLDGL